MAKFIAKNNNYGDRGITKFSSTSEGWDFTKMTIQQLGKELEQSINEKTPVFIWSKKRLNEKFRLDNEKQVLIFNKIENLRAINEWFCNLQAEAIFSIEFIENLVIDKRMRAEHYFDEAVATHKLKLTALETEASLINSKKEHDDIEKEKKRLENDRIRIENETIKSKNDLYNLVISKINFDSFSPIQMTYLLSVLSGINIDAFSDLDIKEKLKDVYVDMEKSKADKARAEVEDFMNSAEFRKWKNDRAKKDAGL